MKKVLVVDDSKLIRQQVSTLLRGAGYEVKTAADGKEGFAVLEGNDELALVICDIDMPNMNGLEMLSEVRKARLRVPVIMLTSRGDPDLIEQAQQLGATAWLVKPYKSDSLLKVVSKVAR